MAATARTSGADNNNNSSNNRSKKTSQQDASEAGKELASGTGYFRKLQPALPFRLRITWPTQPDPSTIFFFKISIFF